MAGSEGFEQMLRSAGLRVTRPRLAVLAALRAAPHADMPSLLAAAGAALGGVSHQAGYDIVRALQEAGLVRRIEPPGSPSRYELRVADNHHHLVCRSCGTIADVDCAVGQRPCLTPSDDRDFLVDEAEVVYWGYCPSCTTLAPSAP